MNRHGFIEFVQSVNIKLLCKVLQKWVTHVDLADFIRLFSLRAPFLKPKLFESEIAVISTVIQFRYLTTNTNRV